MKRIKLLYFCIGIFSFTSCLKEKTSAAGEYDCPNVISYSVDIQPIINTSCVNNLGPETGCHDAWIFNYDNIPPYMEAGLWQHAVIDTRIMPEIPNAFAIDSLTEDQIDLMKCWIQQGYPEN